MAALVRAKRVSRQKERCRRCGLLGNGHNADMGFAEERDSLGAGLEGLSLGFAGVSFLSARAVRLLPLRVGHLHAISHDDVI